MCLTPYILFTPHTAYRKPLIKCQKSDSTVITNTKSILQQIRKVLQCNPPLLFCIFISLLFVIFICIFVFFCCRGRQRWGVMYFYYRQGHGVISPASALCSLPASISSPPLQPNCNHQLTRSTSPRQRFKNIWTSAANIWEGLYKDFKSENHPLSI